MSEPAAPTQQVAVSVTIAAPPETVFRFFADPAWFARWMGPGSTIDLRAGGEVRVQYPQGLVGSGRIVEFDRPRRVVFSFGFEDPAGRIPPGSTSVEVSLAPIAAGTQVTLRHLNIPEAEMLWGASQGWRYLLSVLASRAAEAQYGAQLEALAEAWTRAWNEPAADVRQRLLGECFAVDGTFLDPFAAVSGRTELDDRIAASQAFGPSATLERAGPVQQCHNSIRFAWSIRLADGARAGSGTNYAELSPGGHLQHVVGFWDALPPIGPTT